MQLNLFKTAEPQPKLNEVKKIGNYFSKKCKILTLFKYSFIQIRQEGFSVSHEQSQVPLEPCSGEE